MKGEQLTNGNMLLPAVYQSKSCGFVSTKRSEFVNFKRILIKEGNEAGDENVNRWIASALNG